LSSTDPPFWWPQPNPSLHKLHKGSEPQVALWATVGSANVVELIAAHQPNALLLDREHTTTSLGDIQAMALAPQNACVTALSSAEPTGRRFRQTKLARSGCDHRKPCRAVPESLARRPRQPCPTSADAARGLNAFTSRSTPDFGYLRPTRG
jgi:hypothetical protein